MSNQEQMAAIGRMVTEHGELRRKRAVVASVIGSLGEVCKTLGYEFTQAFRSISDKVAVKLAEPIAAEYLNIGKINDLLSELKTLDAKITEGEARLKELGVR